MRECLPDRRWRRIEEALESKTPPASKTLRRIYEVCLDPPTDTDEDPPYEALAIRDATDIIRVEEDRHVLMIFFLCGATNDELSKSLDIELDVVTLVQQLIFDREEFRNKLEYRRYIRDYAEMLPKEEKELLKAGMSLGPSYLIAYFRQGHEEIQVNEKRYGKLLLEQAVHKALVAKYNSITSKASQYSKGWSKDAVGMIINSDRLGFESGASDRAQALLDEEDYTSTPEEAGLALDEIHH